MTQDEPERVEEITAGLRECAALDWIDSTFAAATMRESADEIERLRSSISVSEKRAENAEADLRETLRGVLHQFGPEGAHKITCHVLLARKSK